jgi:hypothetical protein
VQCAFDQVDAHQTVRTERSAKKRAPALLTRATVRVGFHGIPARIGVSSPVAFRADWQACGTEPVDHSS